jgi:hypothetical protein
MSHLSDVWTNGSPSFRSSTSKEGIVADRVRPTRVAALAVKRILEVVLTLTIISAIMIATAALDMWIWVPHLKR